MSEDTYRAAAIYLQCDAHPQGLLFRGSVRSGELHDYEQATPSVAGDHGMTVSAIQQRVRFLGKVVELPTLSPHDARHYWATKAARNKNDLKTLQEAGGWSSPHMPLEYVQAAAIANEGLNIAD